MKDALKKHKIFIDNAAEDVPRVMVSVGNACGGEFALILRPQDDQHVLVHQTRSSSKVWEAEAGKARVPQMPTRELPAKEAIALVKSARKVESTLGPITYRGQWKGYVTCAEGEGPSAGPAVVLERKVSSYVTVRVVGHGKKWVWTVIRQGKWFKGPAEKVGEDIRLHAALTVALREAVGAASEACGVRDTSRRAAHDPAYAAQHPVKPAKAPAKDPTDKLKAKEPKAPKAPKAPKEPKAPKAASPKGDVIPARTARERELDAKHGPLVVTNLRDLPPTPPKPARAPRKKAEPPAADAAKDQQLLNLFKDAMRQAVSG